MHTAAYCNRWPSIHNRGLDDFEQNRDQTVRLWLCHGCGGGCEDCLSSASFLPRSRSDPWNRASWQDLEICHTWLHSPTFEYRAALWVVGRLGSSIYCTSARLFSFVLPFPPRALVYALVILWISAGMTPRLISGVQASLYLSSPVARFCSRARRCSFCSLTSHTTPRSNVFDVVGRFDYCCFMPLLEKHVVILCVSVGAHHGKKSADSCRVLSILNPFWNLHSFRNNSIIRQMLEAFLGISWRRLNLRFN